MSEVQRAHTEDSICLNPVGIVHSPVRSRHEMPMQGVKARVEIYPEYADALDGVERNSHLFLLCWMQEADRTISRAAPRKISPDLPVKGVFSLRSPARPNPVSLTVVRLIGVCRRRWLDLMYVDMTDGTPVLDIKPYQVRWDCVFSAAPSDRTGKIGLLGPEPYRESLTREAAGYHGEYCQGVTIAVRIAMEATRLLGGDLRREGVRLTLGPDPCINDALIGITGARFGNRRLLLPPCPSCGAGTQGYTLCNDDTRLFFDVKSLVNSGDISRLPDGELFSVTTR